MSDEGLNRIEDVIAASGQRVEQRIVDRLTVVIRDVQNEILRSLDALARDTFARLDSQQARIVSIEQQQLATNERITALEERVLNLDLEVRRPPL